MLLKYIVNRQYLLLFVNACVNSCFDIFPVDMDMFIGHTKLERNVPYERRLTGEGHSSKHVVY